MAKRPGLYEVAAYGHDGSRFTARRRDVHDLDSMLDVAKIELRHQSQWAVQRGLSLQGLEAGCPLYSSRCVQETSVL